MRTQMVAVTYVLLQFSGIQSVATHMIEDNDVIDRKETEPKAVKAESLLIGIAKSLIGKKKMIGVQV